MRLMISSLVETMEERVNKLLLHPLAVLPQPFAILPLLLFLFLLYKWSFVSRSPRKNLPPSPPRLPIIGNLHQIGEHPQRSYKALAEKYGDIMFVYIGRRPYLIISSKEMATQVMKTYDTAFSGKTTMTITKSYFYDGKDILFGAYADQWRQLRGMCMLHLLSSKRVKSFRRLREEEVGLMVERIKKSPVVNLSKVFFLLANHLLCRAAFGRKYDGEGGGRDFDKLIQGTARALGVTNIEDVFPWMSWLNRFNGVRAMHNKMSKHLDDTMEEIFEEHANRAKEESGEDLEKNLVDALLHVQRNNAGSTMPMDKETIKGALYDMFAAGTHTSAVSLEWTFTELIRLPRVMSRLQEEVRSVVGAKGVVVEEDIENMPYLKAVIKESLRFHPPVPLPVTRECIEEGVKLNGYDIPMGTSMIVNLWGLARDPAYWEEPEEFIPERFLGSPLDFRGQHFEYLPFGGGRRGCPGISFSIAGMEFALANLVYWFDWALPNGAKGESIDTSETKGSFAHKRTPLIVVATPWKAK